MNSLFGRGMLCSHSSKPIDDETGYDAHAPMRWKPRYRGFLLPGGKQGRSAWYWHRWR